MENIFKHRSFSIEQIQLATFPGLFYLNDDGYNRCDILVSEYYDEKKQEEIKNQIKEQKYLPSIINERIYFGISEKCPVLLGTSTESGVGYFHFSTNKNERGITILTNNSLTPLDCFISKMLVDINPNKTLSLKQLQQLYFIVHKFMSIEHQKNFYGPQRTSSEFEKNVKLLQKIMK